MASATEGYILALDCGTSGCKASLWDHNGESTRQITMPLKRNIPRSGYVEQDPQLILDTQMRAILEVLSETHTPLEAIKSIGITNQRETVIAWDKETGDPLYPAISWMDRRKVFLRNLDIDDLKKEIKERTGLMLDPYFSAYKMQWIIRHLKKSGRSRFLKNLVFGTVDTWLVWNLSGRSEFVTDWTNASRTMLFNIKTGKWDEKLLDIFGIEESMLPEVTNSLGIHIPTEERIFGKSIPITAVAGDQQASLYGHLCFNRGEVKNTFGTGSFLLMNAGKEPPKTKNLITTVAWKEEKSPPFYAIEGSIFNTGSLLDWIRDGLKMFKDSAQTDAMASMSPADHGLYFIPALNGLGAPYWNDRVKGIIFGITPRVTQTEIVRSALESIAFRVRDLVEAIKEETGVSPKSISVDGKPTSNNFLMQFQSDILNMPVVRYPNHEITSAGVAYMAGKTSGFIDPEELREKRSPEKTFQPGMAKKTADRYYNGWREAVKAAIYSYRRLK